MNKLIALAIAGALAASVWSSVEAGTAAPETNLASPRLEAREAGARYGQALGVALVCYGLKTTPAVERLAAAYPEADQDTFRAEAERVLAAWRASSTCQKSGGPNPCRLAHEWSCRDALREIGPDGTRLPGLVELRN
jgi:hypothetical protein